MAEDLGDLRYRLGLTEGAVQALMRRSEQADQELRELRSTVHTDLKTLHADQAKIAASLEGILGSMSARRYIGPLVVASAGVLLAAATFFEL